MAVKTNFDPVPSSLVIGKEVSRGSFGVVYSATLEKDPVAVKQFHQILLSSGGDSVHFQNFKRECEQLEQLNHPNVVKYIGAYQDDLENGPILVMELMHETLKAYLERNKGNLSPDRVMEICSAVCEGVVYLHGLKNPLIHRDLSDKNVLLTETGVVKIADFGQAKLLGDLNDILQTTQPGAVLYMPPEALKKKKGYTAKVDSFSLGVLMLEICTQSPPSSGLDGINYEIEVKRREDDLRLLDDAHPLKPLIVWCLQYEELRPTVAVIQGFIKNDVQSKETVSQLEANNRKLIKDLGAAEEEIYARIQHEVTITKKLRMTNEEMNRLQHQHQVLSQQYHDSQRTVEELREEIRKLKNQQLTSVHPAAKPVGTSSDSSNRSKAVPKVVEEGPLARIPFGRQEEECYLLANASTSGSCQSVVAFGMTGHGKSTFLNFILRRQQFKTSSGLDFMYSVMKTTESAHAIVEGQQLLLIDTPGFRDTHDIGDEGDNKQDAHEIWEDDFRKNVRLAYLDAGQEVKAFILVYSLTSRWTAEETLMIKFLESLSFPWDHCIVVLTHVDHVFPGMSEEERYEALKDAMAKDKLPKQLKRLITECSDRVLIVENTRAGDEEYHRSIVRGLLTLLDSIPGSYTNPHFLHFAQLFKTSQKESYKMALQDKHSMCALEGKTQTAFESFESIGKEVVVPQTKFIRYLPKAFEDQRFSLAGIFGYNNTYYAGQAYDEAHKLMERLYKLYQKIMRIIQRDDVCCSFPEVHNLLFAHLAGVHMHGVKDKGDELCSVAENLAIYDRIHKQVKEQIKSSKQILNCSNFNSSEISPPNCAFPVRFNHRSGGSVDVVYTVGDKVKVTRLPVASQEADMLLLKTMCIATLEKEMDNLKALCNLPTRRM